MAGRFAFGGSQRFAYGVWGCYIVTGGQKQFHWRRKKRLMVGDLDIANNRVARFACKSGLNRSGGLQRVTGEPKERNALAKRAFFRKRREERDGRGVLRSKWWVWMVALVSLLVVGARGQWSRDPGEALRLPDIPIGYSVRTDSLGGAFVIGADWDWDFTFGRTYFTYLGRDGEFYWDEWVAFMPGVDIDLPLGVFECSAPSYLIAVLWANRYSNGDTLWELRAQKVSTEGERVWPDSGVYVGSRLLPDSVTYVDMIGAVGDGEGGLIIVWATKYYRMLESRDLILERQSFRAQRLSPEGESLWDDNGVEVISDVNGRDGIAGKTVSDGDGGVIMVYHKGGTQVRIIGGQRISADGEKLWGDSGVIYELDSYLYIGDAMSDNQGGVIFSGQGVRDSLQQIRVFRLDQDGHQIWGDGNGLVVQEVYWRTGGVGASWLINATDSIFFIDWVENVPHPHVQAINLEGELFFNRPGVTICDADSIGHTVSGVLSARSAIYGWTGIRPSDEHGGALYCQRLDEEGNRLWADEGVTLFERRGMHVSKIITDCYGGAIFQIGRYLQLINRDGELGIPLTIRSFDQPLAPGIIEYSLFPNPTNGAVTLTFLSPSITNRQVLLFDLQGRLIFQFLIPSGVSSHPMDFSAYPSGNYILQVLPDASGTDRMLNIIK